MEVRRALFFIVIGLQDISRISRRTGADEAAAGARNERCIFVASVS